jgi:superfamily II DNA or RNA helicase
MEKLAHKKHDLKLSTNSRQVKWFEQRGMNIRDYQDEIISLTQIGVGDKIVWAVSPNGGKTEMSICLIDLYLQDNPTHKVLILTHNTKVLRDNYYERIMDNNPTFTHQEVTKDNEVDFTKQVIISLPSTLNKRKLHKFDLVVIDEAHQMYESDNLTYNNSMVKKIIDRCDIKKELLLTGTPSYFIRQNQKQKKEIYKLISVPMSKVYDAGGCSDVIVEMSSSSYYITDSDYRGDELKDGYNFNNKETFHTLDDVNRKLYSRIVSPFRNTKHYSNKELLKPVSNVLDWTIFRKELGKTLISCRNQSQAKKTAEYYENNGINVALSISDVDKDGIEIKKFIEDEDCKILIVVYRGILGFSFDKIVNVIDMSLTKNINRMYQLFCRTTRKYVGVDKIFIKVVPSDREPHFRLRLTGMLCLMHEEWFMKFNGKNFEELDIPTTNRKESTGAIGGSVGGNNSKPKKEPFPMLGLPTMSILKDLYTKRDELYSPVCWSKVGTILRDLNKEIGKRGSVTEEVIEELYKSNEDGLYKDMNVSGNSHIIGKAKELKLHDVFLKKYNIQFSYNRSEEKYLPLLECENYKDAIEKGHKSIYGRLLAVKDDELIKKYTSHFTQLRPNSFTNKDAVEYIDKLKEYPLGVRETHPDQGIYRYVFNRQKETYYNIILKKWGDEVPMLFLKDEDKIKRIKKHIDECKDYNEWYEKYITEKKILERLNKLYLLDKLDKGKNFERNRQSMEKLLNKNKGKFIQDFREIYPNDYGWMMRKEQRDIYEPLIERYLKRKRNKKNSLVVQQIN